LAAHHAAGGVDLLLGHSEAQLRVGTKSAKEAGERRQVPDLDLVGLAARDARKSESIGAGESSAALQYGASIVVWHVSSLCFIVAVLATPSGALRLRIIGGLATM